MVGSLLRRPGLLFASALVVLVVGFQLWITPSNPPGFIRDEASFSYNAYTIGHSLRDQDGGLLPLYLVSFGDYKSPVFVYLLAPVFRLAGPHQEVARALAAVCVLAAVALVGLLAWRRTRSAEVAVAAFVLAGLTPWLFELGRVAFDTSLLPLSVALVLLAAERAYRAGTLAAGVPVGLALGLVAYSYAAGRLIAPLLAAALLVFGRRRWLLSAWGTFVLGLVPLIVYWFRHPGALTARYQATTFIRKGMSGWTIVGDTVWHYVHDWNLWHWVVSGDRKPYIHSGAGQLLGAVAVLALYGAALVVTRLRADRWWVFVLVATLVVVFPSALSEDRFDSLRMSALPLLLAVLAIPALRELRSARPLLQAAAVVLALTALVQFGQFLHAYTVDGPNRTQLFEAGVPTLLRTAFADGATVYIDHDDRYAQTHALWYAISHGIPRDRVSILPDGGIAPTGATVFGRVQPCDYVCTKTLTSYDYWLAKAVGPK
jgi:4-amino-4-deoxy-L-arabinose transferase-like glycosyltransferase